MIRKLLFLIVFLFCSNAAFAAKMADSCLQLRIGIITSGSTGLWNTGTAYTEQRNWVADRFGWVNIATFPYGGGEAVNGTTGQSQISQMRTRNPNIKFLSYELGLDPIARDQYVNCDPTYSRFYFKSDTTDMKNWAVAHGLTIDSLVLVATGTVTLYTADVDHNYYTTTTNAGGIIQYVSFKPCSYRSIPDPRSKWYGMYMAHYYDSLCTYYNLDGIFMDDWGTFNYHDQNNQAWGDAYRGFGMFPFNADSWIAGANSFTKPFGVPGATPFSVANWGIYADSTLAWNTQNNFWWKTLCDSFTKAPGNRIMFMNTDGTGDKDKDLYVAQFQSAIKKYAKVAKGSAQGEYCYVYPNPYGGQSFYDNCRTALRQIADTGGAREWAREWGVFWINVGQFPMWSYGFTLERTQYNALAFMLQCQSLSKFAGNPYGGVQMYYLPSHKNGLTDYYHESVLNFGTTVSLADSTALWNYAWGKYWGLETGTIDTSRSGTDGQGQPYHVDFTIFNKTGSTDTLTLCIGRIGNGITSFDTSAAGSGVNVTLPGASDRNWYPLRVSGRAVSWGTPLPGGSIIKIGNAHFQIFSTDPATSNGGVIDTSLAIVDASVTEGGNLQFVVNLSTPLSNNLTFHFSTSDVTATLADNDYTQINDQVYTINAGQTSKTIDVVTTGDSKVESDETIHADISSITVINPLTGHITRSQAVGTIVNDDITKLLSVNDASANEGSGINFTVTLSQAIGADLTFQVSTSDGTATLSDNDYTQLNNQVYTITAGQTTKTVTVATTADTKVESDETLTITISNPSDGSVSISDNTGAGTIVNDDILKHIKIRVKKK